MPDQVEEIVDEATNLTYYKWKTDLIATKPHWIGWFKDLTA